MFEEHGLNISRQPDNAANPRPDNRSGWLEGQTPDVVEQYLEPAAPSELAGRPSPATVAGDEPARLQIRVWDPSRQLRYRAKRSVPPRPDGAPNRSSRRAAVR